MNAVQQTQWFNEVQRLRICGSNPTAAGCTTSAADEARQFNERQAQRLNSAVQSSSTRPANWNLMDADAQARWLGKDSGPPHLTHLTRCSETGCSSVPNPNYRPFTPAPQLRFVDPPSNVTHLSQCSDAGCVSIPNPNYTYTPAAAAQCGRACGQPWTDADFAAADQEIARLEREIARLRSGLSAPRSLYQAPAPRYAAPASTFTQPTRTTASDIGGTTYYSGAVTGTATSLPPFTYYNFSNGVRGNSTQIGDFTYHNFRNQQGDTTRGTTNTIGDFQYHNFSNGLRGTTTTLGDFKYTNYNDGTRCTTTTLGDQAYTTCR